MAPSLTERDVLTLSTWRDFAVESAPRSIPTASDDALTYWTPSLGPAAMLMAYRLAQHVVAKPNSSMSAPDLARTFGLSIGRLEHTLWRLKRLQVASYEDRRVEVRLMLPPLTRRQVKLLPDYLAAAYAF